MFVWPQGWLGSLVALKGSLYIPAPYRLHIICKVPSKSKYIKNDNTAIHTFCFFGKEEYWMNIAWSVGLIGYLAVLLGRPYICTAYRLHSIAYSPITLKIAQSGNINWCRKIPYRKLLFAWALCLTDIACSNESFISKKEYYEGHTCL